MANEFGKYTAFIEVDTSQAEAALPKLVQSVRAALAQIRADVASGAITPRFATNAQQAVGNAALTTSAAIQSSTGLADVSGLREFQASLKSLDNTLRGLDVTNLTRSLQQIEGLTRRLSAPRNIGQAIFQDERQASITRAPPPGTVVYRGEIRKFDDSYGNDPYLRNQALRSTIINAISGSVGPTVGQHWSTNPNTPAEFAGTRELRGVEPGIIHVQWKAILDSPETQVIPGEQGYGAGHWEREVRLAENAALRIVGAKYYVGRAQDAGKDLFGDSPLWRNAEFANPRFAAISPTRTSRAPDQDAYLRNLAQIGAPLELLKRGQGELERWKESISDATIEAIRVRETSAQLASSSKALSAAEVKAAEEMVTFYHGTTQGNADKIIQEGYLRANVHPDYGLGQAYATTRSQLALGYAQDRSNTPSTDFSQNVPAVVAFQLPKSALPEGVTDPQRYPYGHIQKSFEGFKGQFTEVEISEVNRKLVITREAEIAASKVLTAATLKAAESVKESSTPRLSPATGYKPGPFPLDLFNKFSYVHQSAISNIERAGLPLPKIGLDEHNAPRALGADLGTGVAGGIKQTEQLAITAGKSLVSQTIKGMREQAQAKSPSAVTELLGKDIADGLGLGLKKTFNAIVAEARTDVRSLVNAMTAEAREALKNLTQAFQKGVITEGEFKAEAAKQVGNLSDAARLQQIQRERAKSPPGADAGPGPDEEESAFNKALRQANERRVLTGQLLGSKEYLGDTAGGNIHQTLIDANVSRAVNTALLKYATLLGEANAAEERLNAAVRNRTAQELRSDKRYKDDTVQANVAEARRNAEVTARTNEELRAYASELADASISIARLDTATRIAQNKLLYDQPRVGGRFAGPAQLTDLGRDVISKNALANAGEARIAIQQQLADQRAVTQRDIDERAEATRGRQVLDERERLALTKLIEADSKAFETRAASAVADDRIRARQQIADAAAITDKDRGLIAGGVTAESRSSATQQAANNRALLANVDVLTEETVTRKQLQASLRKAEAANDSYINATAAEKVATEEAANKIKLRAISEQTGVAVDKNLTDVERRATTIVLERMQADLVAAEAARLRSGTDRRAIEATALRQLNEKLYAEQLNVAKRELLKSNPELQQAFGGGTLFQRGLAALKSRQAGGPVSELDQPKFLQYMTEHALRTATFAVSGLGFYAAFSGVKELITNAQQLEVEFAKIKVQFEDLGQQAEFAPFKQAILDISKTTGTAATEIAEVALQMKGFFGNTTEAIKGTQVAIEFAKVSGLGLQETVNSLTALASSYADSATTKGLTAEQIMERITDKAIGIQERFGAPAKDTVNFLGDIAPVADQYQVSLEQAGAIAAVYQQAAGRGAESGAEQLNRVLPEIQNAQVQLIELNQNVLGFGENFNKALAKGNYGAVLDQLIVKWKTLDKSTQNYILTLLGGSRNAQALVTLGNLSEKYTAEKNLPASVDEGKRAKYFKEVQDTLSTTLARLGQSLKEFALIVFDSGLGDLLQNLASIAETFTKTLAILAGALNHIPEPMKSIVTQGTALLLILQGLSKLGELRLAEQILGPTLAGGLGKLAPGALIGQAAKTAEASAAAETVLPAGYTALGGSVGGAAGGGLLARLLGGGAAAGEGGLFAGLGSGLATVAPIAAVLGTAFVTSKAINSIADFNASNKAKQEGLAQLAETNHVSDARLEELIGQQSKSVNILPRVPILGAGAFGPFAPKIANPARVGLEDALQLRTTRAQASAILGLSRSQRGQIFNGDEVFDDKTLKQFAQRGTKDDTDAQGLQEMVADAEKRHLLTDKIVADARKRNIKEDASARKIIEVAGKNGEKLQDLGKTSDELLSGFQAGSESAIAVLAGYDREIAAYQIVVDNGDIDPAVKKALSDRQKARAKFYSDAVLASNKSVGDLLTSTSGGIQDYAGAINRDLVLLKNKRFTDPKDRQQVISEIYDLENKFYKDTASNATSFAESLQLAQQGVTIPPGVAKEALRSQLDTYNIAWQKLVADVKDLGFGQGFADSVLDFSQKYGVSIGEAAKAVIQANIKIVEANIRLHEANFGGWHLDELQRMYKNLADLKKELNSIGGKFNFGVNDKIYGGPDFSGVESERALNDAKAAGDQATLAQDQINAANEKIAIINAAAAKNKNYAKGKYKADLAAAQAELINGQNAAESAAVGLLDAQEGLFDAINSFDPVAIARHQLGTAQQKLALARNATEALQAQTAIIQANKAIAAAIEAAGEAEVDYLIALANQKGDTVQAAKLAQFKAGAHLLSLLQAGAPADSADVREARAALVNAATNTQSVELQKRETNIDTLLQLKKISPAKAIEDYTRLLTAFPLTPDQKNQILLRIQQLKEALGGDLQFNLPSDIRLPTLYEARRFNQSGGNIDNRRISIVITSNEKLDTKQIIDKVTDAVASPPRYGTRARAY